MSVITSALNWVKWRNTCAGCYHFKLVRRDTRVLTDGKQVEGEVISEIYCTKMHANKVSTDWIEKNGYCLQGKYIVSKPAHEEWLIWNGVPLDDMDSCVFFRRGQVVI